VQFASTRVAVPRRASGPDPEPPLGVHEHESSGDRREHPLSSRISRASSSVMCPCCRLMLPDKNLDQPAISLQQISPTGAGSKVGLEVTLIDGVTLSDGHCPGERAPTRR
jgi:hypothetical protein